MCLIYLDSLIWNERILVHKVLLWIVAWCWRYAVAGLLSKSDRESGKGQLETDWLAGHVELELPNPRERYPFEVPR